VPRQDFRQRGGSVARAVLERLVGREGACPRGARRGVPHEQQASHTPPGAGACACESAMEDLLGISRPESGVFAAAVFLTPGR
jgi:hypothetical protein